MAQKSRWTAPSLCSSPTCCASWWNDGLFPLFRPCLFCSTLLSLCSDLAWFVACAALFTFQDSICLACRVPAGFCVTWAKEISRKPSEARKFTLQTLTQPALWGFLGMHHSGNKSE